MSQTLFEYCIDNNLQNLLDEWNNEKNTDFSVHDVSYASNQKVWWRCQHGHEWKAEIKSRACRGVGCPICSHRIIILGINDFTTTHPHLLQEWHPTLNGMHDPSEFVKSTKQKVWWKCTKGHEWQTTIASRIQGRGCPVCAGKLVLTGENDLATHFPSVAEQWNHDRNGDLKPTHVAPYSNKNVWWRCQLGHEWEAKINSRTIDGKGCPYCSSRAVLPGFNDLKSRYPKVALEWHDKLNGQLTPEDVTFGSTKKVWWKCGLGHIWKARIYSRTGSNSGCPVCAGQTNSPYYDIDHEALEKKILAEQDRSEY